MLQMWSGENDATDVETEASSVSALGEQWRQAPFAPIIDDFRIIVSKTETRPTVISHLHLEQIRGQRLDVLLFDCCCYQSGDLDGTVDLKMGIVSNGGRKVW